MSADIFRTNQLIIIMLNQKHSYLTFNKRGKQEMSLEFEPLLPCKKDYSMPRHWIIFFYIFYFLKEFAKVYEFVGSTATLDVAKCKQSLLLY